MKTHQQNWCSAHHSYLGGFYSIEQAKVSYYKLQKHSQPMKDSFIRPDYCRARYWLTGYK
ncbi:unnamed protein product [Brassica rapa subsp. trilocularis]